MLETVSVDGRLLRDTVALPSARLHQDRGNEIEITASRTVVPAEGGTSLDRRGLGLQVRTLAVHLVPSPVPRASTPPDRLLLPQ